jgi:hypothetical protein
VHIKWPGIARNYMVDGRFPPWVVEEDPDATMAGGGFMLKANELAALPKQMSPRLVALVVLLVALIALLLWPAGRDALEGLLRLGR